MKPKMRLAALRDLIADTVAQEKSYEVPAVCVRLGIQESVGETDANLAFKGKVTYVKRHLAVLPEAQLLQVAERLIQEFDSPDVEDVLEELTGGDKPRFSQVVRADILRYLSDLDDPFGDCDPFKALEMALGGTTARLSKLPFDHIWHEHKTTGYLLAEYGLDEIPHRRFVAVLEGILHPTANRGEVQTRIATDLNRFLVRDGFEARPVGIEGGYPLYRIVRIEAGVAGAMKNLIFATIGEKPEIIIRDALNNDVEIVKNADQVLIYDCPLPANGLLRWSDLEDWWMKRHDVSNRKTAKEQLYLRLQRSVQLSGSPGEWAVFRTYHQVYGRRLNERLPALLPQVYLHYDPYTRRMRGDEVYLVRQRMDFLLLLENGVRVVIEIDGRQHYATQTKTAPLLYEANATRYAEMVREDRYLKLRGYEVYRFGGAEFPDVQVGDLTISPCVKATVTTFFDALFDKHRYL